MEDTILESWDLPRPQHSPRNRLIRVFSKILTALFPMRRVYIHTLKAKQLLVQTLFIQWQEMCKDKKLAQWSGKLTQGSDLWVAKTHLLKFSVKFNKIYLSH